MYYSAHHPNLHSFPTRRSSDLCSGRNRDVEFRTFHMTLSGLRLSGRGCPLRDRKSTRLNSSHRTISYAVLCLKKKKTIILCVDCECRDEISWYSSHIQCNKLAC